MTAYMLPFLEKGQNLVELFKVWRLMSKFNVGNTTIISPMQFPWEKHNSCTKFKWIPPWTNLLYIKVESFNKWPISPVWTPMVASAFGLVPKAFGHEMRSKAWNNKLHSYNWSRRSPYFIPERMLNPVYNLRVYLRVCVCVISSNCN